MSLPMGSAAGATSMLVDGVMNSADVLAQRSHALSVCLSEYHVDSFSNFSLSLQVDLNNELWLVWRIVTMILLHTRDLFRLCHVKTKLPERKGFSTMTGPTQIAKIVVCSSVTKQGIYPHAWRAQWTNCIRDWSVIFIVYCILFVAFKHALVVWGAANKTCNCHSV